MKNSIFVLILITFVFTSCNTESNPNLITKNNIGLLNDSTQVKDLKIIFANDSIVKYTSGDEFIGNINDIQVYKKGGDKLLVLTPSQSLDSTATIKTIRIIDPKFKTNEGLHINSTFKDIKDNYKVSGIDKTLRSLIVSVDEINAFFTISKDELPAELWFNTNSKIEILQIPDDTKLNAFFMQWSEK